MKILILEDEIPAFEKLHKHLDLYFEKRWKYDWGKTIVDGKQYLTQHTYDLIFADIELLDDNVFKLFDAVEISTPIIFCSAYNEYLLNAFKTNGIAYILKPFYKNDLETALSKYKKLFSTDKKQLLDKALFQQFSELLQEEKRNYKESLLIKQNQEMYLLDTKDISHIIASGVFCKLIDAQNKTHLYSESISSLFEKLNPKYFFRINRSEIINTNHIVKIQKYFKNRLSIEMRGAKEHLKTSSAITPSFRVWLENR